jgi:hypothetical protein
MAMGDTLYERTSRVIGKEYTRSLRVRFVTHEFLQEFLINYRSKLGDICHAVFNGEEAVCLAIFNGYIAQMTDVMISPLCSNHDYAELILKFTQEDMSKFSLRPPDYTLVLG